MKEKIWKRFFRNVEKELDMEIMRVYDAMAMEDPTSTKYGILQERYINLQIAKEEYAKMHNDVKKALIVSIGGIGGIIFYRWCINSSEEPFFKEIGKIMLKVGASIKIF